MFEINFGAVAGVLAILLIVLSEKIVVRPNGLQASTRMPFSLQKETVSYCSQPGWNSIWSTIGSMRQVS